MAQAGTAFVDIQPDMSTFQSQVAAQLAPITSKFGKMGTAAAAGLGAVVIGAAAAGKALYDVGAEFDDAYDRIRVGTGATGRELKQLQSDFRDVLGRVPADMGTVSEAITGLNKRLDLTGAPLKRLSYLMVELSRITETDVTENVRTVARVFQDFKVSTTDQADALNFMFRASQATGASVSELADITAKFGSTLRQFGFSLEESVAMFGLFEKTGVNVAKMVPGLTIALSNFLEQGIDPRKGLLQAFKDIRSGAMTSSEAIELFGKRAGADMVEAIKQGRFNFQKFVKLLQNGKDTIDKSANSTKDLSESFEEAKNNLKLLFEPLATPLFAEIGETAKDASDAFKDLRKEFNRVKDSLGPLAAVFRPIGRIIMDGFAGPIQMVRLLGKVVGWVAGRFEFAQIKIKPAVAGFKNAGKAIGTAASDAFKAVKKRFQDMVSFVKSLPDKFAAAGKAVGNAIKNGVKAGLSGLSNIVRSMAQAAIDALKEAVNSKIRTINSIIGVADSLTPSRLPRIPELAKGTSNFQGGMALVGEQGPELVNLPRGSKVFTASQTRQIAASGIGSAGAPEVRVFIGDRELTDIVRVEMREKDRAARANYRTGVV